MGRPHTPTHCHCGAHRRGSDHCPECGCEEYESRCDHTSAQSGTTVAWSHGGYFGSFTVTPR